MKPTTKKLTPIKSIRKNCIECSGGSFSEVYNCGITDCPLWIYRLGKRPKPLSVANDSSKDFNGKLAS
jgi:hypothetical protein